MGVPKDGGDPAAGVWPPSWGGIPSSHPGSDPAPLPRAPKRSRVPMKMKDPDLPPAGCQRHPTPDTTGTLARRKSPPHCQVGVRGGCGAGPSCAAPAGCQPAALAGRARCWHGSGSAAWPGGASSGASPWGEHHPTGRMQEVTMGMQLPSWWDPSPVGVPSTGAKWRGCEEALHKEDVCGVPGTVPAL